MCVNQAVSVEIQAVTHSLYLVAPSYSKDICHLHRYTAAPTGGDEQTNFAAGLTLSLAGSDRNVNHLHQCGAISPNRASGQKAKGTKSLAGSRPLLSDFSKIRLRLPDHNLHFQTLAVSTNLRPQPLPVSVIAVERASRRNLKLWFPRTS